MPKTASPRNAKAVAALEERRAELQAQIEELQAKLKNLASQGGGTPNKSLGVATEVRADLQTPETSTEQRPPKDPDREGPRRRALPLVVLPELHAANGRIDAQRVANFMGVPLKPLGEGLGLNYKAIHRNPSAGGFQKALQPVKRSLEILHEFFGPKETIRIWLNTPHPDLDGATSLDTILAGKAIVVSRILGNAWNGVPL